MKLQNINAIPKKTWNYLKINDTTITLDDVPETSFENQPLAIFETIQTGCSSEVHNLFAKAAPLQTIEVNGSERLKLVIDDSVPFRATDIVVKPGASLELCLYTTTKKNVLAAHTLRLKIEAQGRVELTSYVENGSSTTYIQDFGVELDDSAQLNEHHFYLSGSKTYIGHALTCTGTKSTHSSHTRYKAGSREFIDMNYISNMEGAQSKSDYVVSGVLEDRAKKRLAMTIDLKRGCTGSSGTENETALIFGDGVTNKTIPIILCHEDEVSASHGSTIGSISPEQLDYLKSRGLNEEEIIFLFSDAIKQDAAAHMQQWEQ